MNEALCAVLSIDLTTRQRGEAFLRNAQSCDPHFFSALLMASDPATGLPEAARLLAATQLKNEAVRHWKSGAAHSHERLALRTALATRLTQPEPSLRVGVQLALAVARVMRSEAGAGEASVLESFASTLSCTTLPSHALLAQVPDREAGPLNRLYKDYHAQYPY